MDCILFFVSTNHKLFFPMNKLNIKITNFSNVCHLQFLVDRSILLYVSVTSFYEIKCAVKSGYCSHCAVKTSKRHAYSFDCYLTLYIKTNKTIPTVCILNNTQLIGAGETVKTVDRSIVRPPPCACHLDVEQ